MIGTRRHRPGLMRTGAAAAALAMMITGSAAQVTEDVVIDGTPVTFEKRSLQCDIDPGDIPEDISIRRLADCYSAKHVVMRYNEREVPIIKFTIKPTSTPISKGIRAELRDMFEAANGEESWYRFATLLPRDFRVDAPHRLVLTQWHEHVREGKESLRPPLSHRLWNGRFVVTLWNNERVAERGKEGDGAILFEIPEFEYGVWYEHVYKIVWSPGAEGEIVGWMRQCPALDTDCDGVPWQEIIRYTGSTGYDDEDVVGYYFKLGLYTVTDFDAVFTGYHRDYKSGRSAAEIGLTDPLFR